MKKKIIYHHLIELSFSKRRLKKEGEGPSNNPPQPLSAIPVVLSSTVKASELHVCNHSPCIPVPTHQGIQLYSEPWDKNFQEGPLPFGRFPSVHIKVLLTLVRWLS